MNRYPQMVHEYFVQRVRRVMEDRHARIQALRTRKDAEHYVYNVRKVINRAFKPCFPAEKCELASQVTGMREYRDFILEKIVYQSRPGFFVTGNLYRPKKLDAPAPGVLGVCGHALAGKYAYRSFAQTLGRKGFVCLIIDPVSQGERWQHDQPRGAPMPGLCHAHNLMGNQMFLVDDFFGSWRAWDGLRGLDYLLSRPEVDRKRVGVTGNSGGGTLTSFLTALDPRFTMAAPSCYICSMQVSLENECPADAEQNPPGLIAGGLDQADLLLAYAPRPTMILAQYYDFFDCRFSRQAYEDVKRVHELLGARDTVAYHCGPTIHGYSVHNREAMYWFFLKQAGMKGASREPRLVEMEEAETHAAPRGDVAHLKSARVFDFLRARADALAAARGAPTEKQLIAAARKVLGLKKAARLPHYRVTQRYNDVYPALKMRGQYLVETEPGILTVLSSCGGKEHHPQHLPTGRIIAYIGNHAGAQDLLQVKPARALLRDRRNVVVIDPRGLGESEARTCGVQPFFAPYNADYLYAATSDMLDECYLGRRVHDVLRSLDLLYAEGASHVQIVGRGLGAVIAAFAALLHPRKPAVQIFHYLPSFRMITEAQYFTWPLSTLPRGVLKHFDLPDVYRVLGRRLKRSAPWNEQMK
ncbi:MAG: hypothetical protein ABR497_12125 [Kiritimatiellia bacterium]